jgi:hypothetical protein
MGNLPQALSTLESIDVSSREDQIDLGAVLVEPPVNREKVALAVGYGSFDFNQLIGDVMTRPFIPTQRLQRPWNEICGFAFEQSVIVRGVGVIDTVQQLRVTTVYPPGNSASGLRGSPACPGAPAKRVGFSRRWSCVAISNSSGFSPSFTASLFRLNNSR